MMILHWKHGLKAREGERDVGITWRKIYDCVFGIEWCVRGREGGGREKILCVGV